MSDNQAFAELLHLLETGRVAEARALLVALQDAQLGATQLAAEVLHEVRQPLLGIKAYAQLLEEGTEPQSVARLVLAQAERIEAIIDDFTRLASNRPAPREPLALPNPVRAAVAFFRQQPGHEKLQIDVALEPVEVIGNPRLLEQLTLNLLSNAAEALRNEGRIAVAVRRDDGTPVLDVADWGPGIPAEQAATIFQPYVTGRARASGLGLAVCKRIAGDHGAELALAPPTVMGGANPPSTVFRLRFPAESRTHEEQKRILVVDDESIICQVFVELMGKECEVVTAETAEQGLAHLGHEGFDLIVTDKNLPGMSGLELAREARRRDPHSRVVLMTGYPSLVTAQEALELGVLDYLLKPFDDIREVRDLLRAILAAPRPDPVASRALKRVDVLESDPDAAELIGEALALLGMETRVVRELETPIEPAPAAVVVSWDFEPAHGTRAVALARQTARGAPFVVLAEHLSLDCTLESLKGGASACLPKLTRDAHVLSRELARALMRPRDHDA